MKKIGLKFTISCENMVLTDKGSHLKVVQMDNFPEFC